MAASLEHGKSLKRHEYQVCQEQQFIIYLFIYQLDFYSVSNVDDCLTVLVSILTKCLPSVFDKPCNRRTNEDT